MRRACPVCGGEGGAVLVRRAMSRLLRCRGCGVAYQDPPAPPASVQGYYQQLYEDASASDRIDERRRALFAAFLDRVADGRGRRLLDIGCGTGEFMALARARGWEACGVEVSPEAVETARRHGLSVSLGMDGTEAGDRLAFDDGFFDVVTCWNVIEFFRRPVEELRELARVLAPAGHLFIRTQNEAFHLGAYRLGRLVRWPPPLALLLQRSWVVHPLLWSPRTLRAALERAGFEDVHVANSEPSRGDPYAVLGRDGVLSAVKALVQGTAQAVYALSGARVVLGSSLAVVARRAPVVAPRAR